MDTQLIVRLLVSIIAAINAAVAMLGIAPLEVTEEQIYTVVSVLAMVGTWVWGFWKNNNFTSEAKEAQDILNIAKANRGARVAEEDLISENTEEE